MTRQGRAQSIVATLFVLGICQGFLIPERGQVPVTILSDHRLLPTTSASQRLLGVLRQASTAISRSRESNDNDDDSSFSARHFRRREQRKDVVIIGSGLAGLSTALYLTQLDPDRHVTIYDREEIQTTSIEGKNVASFAAAGMLAPQSERLPKGDLLDLCVASRGMFRDFKTLVESLAKESGEEGFIYLPPRDEKNHDLEPWDVGYVSTGGFLAPAFAGDNVATWAPPDESGTATWLAATQVREHEPY